MYAQLATLIEMFKCLINFALLLPDPKSTVFSYNYQTFILNFGSAFG